SLCAASVSQADPGADWTMVRASEPGIGSIAFAHSRTTSRRHARHRLMPSHVEHWRTSSQRVHRDTIGVRIDYAPCAKRGEDTLIAPLGVHQTSTGARGRRTAFIDQCLKLVYGPKVDAP